MRCSRRCGSSMTCSGWRRCWPGLVSARRWCWRPPTAGTGPWTRCRPVVPTCTWPTRWASRPLSTEGSRTTFEMRDGPAGARFVPPDSARGEDGWQGRGVGRTQLFERQDELTLHIQRPRLALDHTDAGMGEAPTCAKVAEPNLFTGRHRDDRPSGRLTEQQSEGINAIAPADLVQPDPGPDAVSQGRLRQGDRQAALGQGVSDSAETLGRGVHQDLTEPALGVKVDARRQTTKMVVRDLGPGRATELVGRGSQQVDDLTGAPPARGRPTGHIVHDA